MKLQRQITPHVPVGQEPTSSARLEQLVSERTKALREALDAASSHIPKYVEESGGGLVEGYMACSCGLKANGVTRWEKLWSDHIRAILKDGQP